MIRKKINLKIFLPNYNNGRGISYTCASIARYIRSKKLKVSMWVYASDHPARFFFIRDAIPPLLKGMAYRLDKTNNIIGKIAEERFLKNINKEDIVYIWPGHASFSLYEKIKKNGNILVREMINTHGKTYNNCLEKICSSLRWRTKKSLTKVDVEKENAELDLADFIFSPSPLVKKSLIEGGIPERKIISSSYGWDPRRLKGKKKGLPYFKGTTFLFVGTVCLRKGIPWLLKAWAKAKINGRLVLVGKIYDDIASRYHSYFKRSDIIYFDYTDEVSGIYHSADVFVFPSHEESGPLVTYEAMGCGLPVIVSPMGAGAIVQNNKNGLIVDPYDIDSLARAIRKLAKDNKLREKMGKSAKQRAKNFTWVKVGKRRNKLLLKALSKIC